MSAGTAKAESTLTPPDKPGVTTRMMDLLELLDGIQNQCDVILGAALGHDSTPREAGPSAILDYQVDFAIGQARMVSDKLATICSAI